MAFGNSKNRRRVDAVQRKAHVSARARSWGPTVLRFFGILIVCASLVYGGHTTWKWAIAAPFFALKELTFSGLEQATEHELRRVSGIAAGQNLFLMDPSALERAMLQHPWISTIEVRRRFPSGVLVTATEHEPVAVTILGDLYLVDREGEPFKRVQVGDNFDLPLITGLTREAYVADPVEAAAQLRRGLVAIDAYRAAKLERTGALSEVRLEVDGLTLITGKDGEEVRLSANPEEDAFARLAKVRAELKRRSLRAEIIHLNNRSRPGWVAVKVTAAGSERTGRSVQ